MNSASCFGSAVTEYAEFDLDKFTSVNPEYHAPHTCHKKGGELNLLAPWISASFCYSAWPELCYMTPVGVDYGRAKLLLGSMRILVQARREPHHPVFKQSLGWAKVNEAELASTDSAASRTVEASAPFHLPCGFRFQLFRLRHFFLYELPHFFG